MRLMIQKCLVLRYNTMGEEGIVVPRGNRELEYLNSIMEDMTEADVDMLGCAEFTDENMVAFHSAGFKEAQDDARKLVDAPCNIQYTQLRPTCPLRRSLRRLSTRRAAEIRSGGVACGAAWWGSF